MKYLTKTALIIIIFGICMKLNAQISGGRIGVVGRVNIINSEVIINLSIDGNTLRLGDILYLKVEKSIVQLNVTFPMQTVAKCKVNVNNQALIKKIKKGMPVYRYYNDPEVNNQNNEDTKESGPGNILYEDAKSKRNWIP